MSQNNFYITTPIYYPSGEPHMGHAYSSILADVFARFKRNDNNNVFFLTGTDEHGLKIQTAAAKSGLNPLIYCDKISSIFKDLTTKLNLSNDDFIRTTEKRHHKSVSDLWCLFSVVLMKSSLDKFSFIVKSLNIEEILSQ